MDINKKSTDQLCRVSKPTTLSFYKQKEIFIKSSWHKYWETSENATLKLCGSCLLGWARIQV